MSTRAEQQDLLIAEQFAFQQLVRNVEDAFPEAHADLLNWGRWSDERFPGCPPEYVLPRFLELVGEDEHDREPRSQRELVREAPPNERQAIAMDVRIHNPEFVALWRSILFVNYVWRPVEWERPGVVLANRGRPDQKRGIQPASYLEQLRGALERLSA